MISIVKFGSEGWRPAASKVRQHTDQTLTDPLSGPWATRQLHRGWLVPQISHTSNGRWGG